MNLVRPDNRIKDANNFCYGIPAAVGPRGLWDLDLEYRIGEAIGDETEHRSNMLLGPVHDIIRHPYWGRTQETYSETCSTSVAWLLR